MNKNQKWIALFVSFFLLTTGAFYAVWADHEGHKEWRWYEKIFDWDDDDDDDEDNTDHSRGKKRRRYQKRKRNDFKHYGKRYLAPINNPAYIEECEERAKRVEQYAKQAKKKTPIKYKGVDDER